MWDDAGLEKTEELSSLAAEGWSVRNYYERGFFRDQFSVLANQRAGCGTLCISGWMLGAISILGSSISRVSLFSTTAKP